LPTTVKSTRFFVHIRECDVGVEGSVFLGDAGNGIMHIGRDLESAEQKTTAQGEDEKVTEEKQERDEATSR
jgi:hypothetical protein